MFAINSISDVDSAEVEIKHPVTLEGIGAFVTLAGPENMARKALEFSRQRRLREEVRRTGRAPVLEPEDAEDEQLQILATCVLGWRGFADDAGVEIVFTREKARELLGSSKLAWLRGQLLGVLQDRDVFIATSAPA